MSIDNQKLVKILRIAPSPSSPLIPSRTPPAGSQLKISLHAARTQLAAQPRPQGPLGIFQNGGSPGVTRHFEKYPEGPGDEVACNTVE